jgi:hypothetical protein
MSLTPPSSHGGSGIGPVAVTGTPSAGETIVADSAVAAHWGAAPTGGSGSLQGQLKGGDVLVGAQSLKQASPLVSNGTTGLSIQSPPLAIPAMGSVCQVEMSAPADVPDISDNIDVTGTLYVTDATGTNTLIVNGNSSQATPITGVGASIDWTGTSATIVGVDLTWDDTTASVSSTAGGVYQSTLILSCAPD